MTFFELVELFKMFGTATFVVIYLELRKQRTILIEIRDRTRGRVRTRPEGVPVIANGEN